MFSIRQAGNHNLHSRPDQLALLDVVYDNLDEQCCKTGSQGRRPDHIYYFAKKSLRKIDNRNSFQHCQKRCECLRAPGDFQVPPACAIQTAKAASSKRTAVQYGGEVGLEGVRELGEVQARA